MRRGALALAVGATTIALTVPAAASAGTYRVDVCHTQAQNDTPGAAGGWSSLVGGSAISANATPSAWLNVCSRYRNNVGNWAGIGGAFGDTTAAGSYAFAKFVPPAGSSITEVLATQDLVVTNGSYAEAGMFNSSGAALDDNSYFLNGGGESSRQLNGYRFDMPIDGIMFGSRCPATLPPAAGGYCGGAGTAVYDLEITVNDPSDPTVAASLDLDAAGRANLTWAGSDPQSGIATTTVAHAGAAAPASEQLLCNLTVAPPCPVAANGSSSSQLAEGETATYTVSVATKWGGTASKTMSVTRPKTSTPPPATPPATTPPTPPATTPTPPAPGPPTATAKVTLKTKALKGRRVALSGSARGCKRVSVKTPGAKRSETAKVKRGKWSLTVSRKRGTYRASCGSAAVKRSVR